MRPSTTIYAVFHEGTRALFSALADAQTYASDKTQGGKAARVRQVDIPEGSEELWNVDVTLPPGRRRVAAKPAVAPEPPPSPRRREPEPEPEPEPEEPRGSKRAKKR